MPYFAYSRTRAVRFSNLMAGIVTVQLLLIALSAAPGLAQLTGTNPGAGLPSFGSFAGSEFDTVNEGNLNIHFSIPVFQKTGRGLSVVATISYNSLIWTPVGALTDGNGNPISSAQWVPPAINPWGFTLSPFTSYVTFTRTELPASACPSNGNRVFTRSNYTFHAPDGTGHSMSGTAVEADCAGTPHGFGPVMTQDGSGYSLSVDSGMGVSVTTIGGDLSFPVQLEVFANSIPSSMSFETGGELIDTNGNLLGIGLGITDTLGTQAMQITHTSTSDSLTYPSPTNPTTYVGVTLHYTTFTIQTNFLCGWPEYGPTNQLGPTTAQLVTSIVMPDGSSYGFTYEPTPGAPANTTGRLTSVTLPTGATIQYAHGAADCADGSDRRLTRTTPDGTWTYTRQITETAFANGQHGQITSSITTVTDPLGNVQVINFGKGDMYEAKRQIFSGSSNLLETIETCYSGAAFPCTNTQASGSFTQRTVRREFPDTTGKVSQTDTHLLLSGLVTDVYEYDFGSGSPGPVLRHTATTYNTLTANIFYNPSQPTVSYASTIYNRPATVTVTDTSGATRSQTSYFYDETTPTATSGTPAHVQVTGSRGNVTTVKKFVSGTTTIQKTTTYFDTGTVATDTDFKVPANVTTYGYGANSCGNSYPDTVTNPLWLEKTTVWDCNGGVATSIKDQNNQTTLYKYGDPNYWRLTETDFPDGGVVSTAYNLGTNSPWNIVQTTKQTSTQNIVRETIYDSLARVLQQQLTTDPDGTDLTDTTYDAAGHVHSVSNPHRATVSSTDGLTLYTYDGLGRVIAQTEPDGSSSETAYNANCTTVTDEAGNARKSCKDGLGRLVEVDEPGAGAVAAKRGTGGIVISGTTDQSGTFNVCPGNPNGPCEQTFPDSGQIFVTVGGFQLNSSYGLNSSGSTIASDLAAKLNASASPVTASSGGAAAVGFTSRELGAAGNYAWSADVTWDPHFTAPSFSPCSGAASCSGTMSGGADATFGSAPLVTLYQYDTLGNLTCAVQKGTDTTAFTTCAAAPTTWRPRSFTYDMLSRLLNATNPESGTITYTYDNNGNVASKVSPKPNPGNTGTITTNYAYDALNRLLDKTYVGGITTTAAKYAYDGGTLSCPGPSALAITSPTNLKGHRTAMCSSSSASSWSYDPMGRPLVERINHTNSNVNKTLTYSYNFDGSLKTLTYPSGDVVTYTTSGAGRATNVSDASNNYVAPPSTAPMYTAAGLLVGMKNGTAISTVNGYNSRLQPVTLSAGITSATLMSISYNFHAGNGDNGNVFQIINNLDSTRSTAFQYDPLNRIQQANTITTTGANCWGEVYTIDNWGNLTNRAGVSGMTGCSTEGLSLAASVKNQLSGLTYDLAGNVTNDGNGNMPVYDSENRMVSDAGVTSSYDADGRRMEKSSGTLYWYGSSGEVLAESNLSGTINEEYIFFSGERIARVDRPSGTVHYYFSDNLGSSSVITDAVGTVQEQYFYYPYGGMVAQIGSDSNHYKFTAKERDSESGLDNFGARYYGSTVGRFMVPDWADKPTDVPYANFGNPQSLNLYSYVNNNPTTTRDPDGHCIEDACVAEVAVVVAVIESPEGQEAIEEAEGAAAQILPAAEQVAGNGWNFIKGVAAAGAALLSSPSGDKTPGPPTPKPSANANEKTKDEPEPEPEPEAASGGARKGGGAEHTRGARRSTYNRHTGTRSGDRKPPGYKSDRDFQKSKEQKKQEAERRKAEKDRKKKWKKKDESGG